MSSNDAVFKATIRQHPEHYLQRLLPGAEFIEFLPTELDREPLRADILLRMRYQGQEYILHIELQSAADAAMARRLASYALLAHERDKLPVWSIVIFLFKCTTPKPPWIVQGPQRTSIIYDFDVVRLWEESFDDWLATGLSGLLVLAPLLKGATLDRLDEVAPVLESIEDPVHRANSFVYLLQFANRQFGVKPVLDYLKGNPMINELFKNSELTKEYVDRAGEEGEIRGQRRTLLALIEERFPALHADGQVVLENIKDSARLDNITVGLLKAQYEAEARHILGLPSA